MEVSFSKDSTNPATPVVAATPAPAIEVAAVVTPAATAAVAAAAAVPTTQVTEPVTTQVTPQVAPQVAPQVPAVTGAGAVATQNNALLLGDTLPNFSEMILPRINLVQFSGVLKDSFEPGTILFNQQVPLHIPAKINEKDKTLLRTATPPVTMTFLGWKNTRYVEKVPGGGKGLLVNTEAAVTANGGTLDYNEWKLKRDSGMKRFEYYKECMVLIERPELVADDDSVFTFELEGKKFTIAMWALKGSAYTNLYKKILAPARRMGPLAKAGFPSWSFSLSSREQITEGNKYFIPFALPKAKTSAEVMEFIRGVITGAPTASTGAEESADTAE